MLTKRTQILFDKNMWQKLSALAKKHQTSVGDIVRTAVKKHYEEEELYEQRGKAITAIHAFRKKYGKTLGKGEDSVTIIRKMREERTKHILDVIEGRQ